MEKFRARQKTFQDTLYEGAARSKPLVIFFTNTFYLLLLGIILLTTYSAYTDQKIFNFFIVNRAWFGRLALLFLLIVITPGILGRFNIQIKATRAITLYRRRLGILVFLIAFTHYHLVSLPKLVGLEPFQFPFPLFQMFGFYALVILFLMFVTSNNLSVKRLGKWWKRFHRLVYIALLFILLHTALQRTSIWSILAGIFFVLEIISLAYAYLKGGSFDNPSLKQNPKAPSN